ncbi:hypothetical protein ACIPWE_06515 [Streptomyces sp. NPDC090073]|uniref:hypothetical protein n=1 Tax=Streptomyces sp. NPDC090073 TaxID=3365936 RepID=UPI0037FBF9F3
MTIDFAVAKKGDCQGTFTTGGASAEIRQVGDAAYMKGDEKFWQQMGGEDGSSSKDTDALVEILKGRWFKMPAQDAKADDKFPFCDIETMSEKDEKEGRPTRKEDSVVNIDSGSKQCYDTFRVAIAESTNGRITAAPLSAKHIDQKPADRLKASSGANAAASVQLGVVYTDSNYGGSSMTLTAGTGCQSGNGRDFQYDLDGIWNNSISSLATLSCWLELWDAPNTAGFHQEYQQATSYVGDAMSDRASSIAMP